MQDKPQSGRQAIWPNWLKLVAYVILIAISGLAVFYVDLKVHVRPAKTGCAGEVNQ